MTGQAWGPIISCVVCACSGGKARGEVGGLEDPAGSGIPAPPLTLEFAQ